MKKFLLTVCLLLVTIACWGREVYDLNRGWKFYTYDERDSVRVNLPHTWNMSDAFGGNAGYYRGVGNYFRYVQARPEWREKRVFVKFYGANTVTDLIVNGKHAGEHQGGDKAFCIEITDHLNYKGRNLLWVMVNNSERSDVLPTAGEDIVYGGLFRNVELVIADKSLIGMDEWGGDGVSISVSSISGGKVSGAANVVVNSLSGGTFMVDLNVRDTNDSIVYRTQVKHKADKGISEVKVPFDVASDKLWRGVVAPYLYNFTVSINDGGKRDSVTVRSGLREVRVDSKEGFLLNGEHYPLRGVTVWRDRAGVGIVTSKQDIDKDIAIIREIGANAVRVAGGMHNSYFYSRCDEEGIVVVTDGPLIGAATLDTKGFFNTGGFKDNARRQFMEMVRQRVNNPSVVAWSVFVEPELQSEVPLKFIGEVNSMLKKIDPSRFTVGVSNRDGDINKIPDAIIWSHTLGWLSGVPEDISIWLEQLRNDVVWNKTCSAVGYRAGGSVKQYTDQLVRPNPHGWRHPENWQSRFHEVYVKTLSADNKLWAVFAGDMFEHASPRYLGGDTPGVNNCGMVSFDRSMRKDAFWLYKANWNKIDQFIHIAGKRHIERRERVQNITVYSNIASAELFLNGASKGVVNMQKGILAWNGIELKDGANDIEVKSTTKDVVCSDSMVVNYITKGRI